MKNTITLATKNYVKSFIKYCNIMPSISSVNTKLNFNSKFMYHERVIDHYEQPRNVGSLDKNDKKVGTGLVGAPACGDVMKLQIKVSDDGTIEKAVFKTFGCGSAIASSSLATEWLKGKSVDEALAIDNMAIVEELALPPVKIHCSVLAEDAIKSAIKDYREKNGIETPAETEKSH